MTSTRRIISERWQLADLPLGAVIRDVDDGVFRKVPIEGHPAWASVGNARGRQVAIPALLLWHPVDEFDSSSPQADTAPCGEDTPSATSPSRDRRGGRSQTSGTKPGDSASSPTRR